jgi:hypothetical protein
VREVGNHEPRRSQSNSKLIIDKARRTLDQGKKPKTGGRHVRLKDHHKLIELRIVVWAC